MIISLALDGRHHIEADKYGRIYINQEGAATEIKVSIEKEIPAVRYRFEHYTQEDIDYIEKSMARFKNSAHIVEVEIGKHTSEEMLQLAEKDQLAMFVYLPIQNEDVANASNKSFERLIEALSQLPKDLFYERLIIRDTSNEECGLFIIEFERIRDALAPYCTANNKEIGVCSSPLSPEYGGCLSASMLRKIAADYCESPDIALPSSNHQNRDCCGCIRYFMISENLRLTESAKKASKLEKPRTTKNSGDGDSSDSPKKKKSASKFKAYTSWKG